ncbi:Transcriptional regulator, BadM/Rrf2 family [Sphingobium herbicidovorans NBRC 16415]|uniref:Transcriptional regulator, BadM/Rrf2 family n=1 Tax=Sphingobium herbicidovorans (strain ATCC 700291 / DSM 11019 / CCUG 56400 / KCTC 2939 / LMG 18315 / NBRC 16415 / MH) TaxID=1219045 RepID=A0A086P9P7_SPHHM|nr:Rrf2 family transcriptional regulator [Sphingobium herbicidovorans]KFG90115.1 Transcriptional regulator, BadM/Rrf2 family [Sphingobium herbicidovorans NBRC 16415]
MQLTRHTDYALRVLIHLAVSPTGRATIADIADAYALSRNHLMKVVHHLGQGDFIITQRGRGGGFSLARSPAEIMLGAVIRHTETDMNLADCGSCALRPACGLSGILKAATNAFLAVLDQHSLADAARDKAGLAALIAALPGPTTLISDGC